VLLDALHEGSKGTKADRFLETRKRLYTVLVGQHYIYNLQRLETYAQTHGLSENN